MQKRKQTRIIKRIKNLANRIARILIKKFQNITNPNAKNTASLLQKGAKKIKNSKCLEQNVVASF